MDKKETCVDVMCLHDDVMSTVMDLYFKGHI